MIFLFSFRSVYKKYDLIYVLTDVLRFLLMRLFLLDLYSSLNGQDLNERSIFFLAAMRPF